MEGERKHWCQNKIALQVARNTGACVQQYEKPHSPGLLSASTRSGYSDNNVTSVEKSSLDDAKATIEDFAVIDDSHFASHLEYQSKIHHLAVRTGHLQSPRDPPSTNSGTQQRSYMLMYFSK
mmetsp:Transcript_36347/g.87699  ORF Transcript_36347/g.87699 Transcript_36347/m.87699 type:complete len:122 (-) Transcript_36347:443-808(-)